MPLYILVPLIAVGLPVLVGIVYWVTRDYKTQVLNAQAATARLQQDFPGFVPAKVFVGHTGTNALLTSDDGREIYLVQVIGQNHLTRPLEKRAIRKVEETTEGINLFFRDFTLGRVSVILPDKETRKSIMKLLNRA